MDLTAEKSLLLVVLLFLGFGAGFLPFLLRNKCLSPSRFRDKLVSFLNCVAAGVFFATFFMHMLPEAQEQVKEVFGPELSYPYAELILSTGFFFVMLVEQLVITWHGCGNKRRTELRNRTIENAQATLYSTDHQSMLLGSMELVNNNNYNTLHPSATAADEEAGAGSDPDSSGDHRSPTNFGNGGGKMCVAQRSVETEEVEVSIVDGATAFTVDGGGEDDDDHHHHHQHGDHVHDDPSAHSSVRALVLLLALSSHALFEGLAIGLQSKKAALRTLVAAVLIHKMTLAFSYGMSLVTNKATVRIVLTSMIIFSVMAPIGIAVGIGLTSIQDAGVLVEQLVAVLQAFASGTFVYVIFIEILPHEFGDGHDKSKMANTVCLLIGFAAMAAVQALPHEEEEEE